MFTFTFHEERNMGVAKKDRRNIIVSDKRYVWYVEMDHDSPYIISKGNTFQK